MQKGVLSWFLKLFHYFKEAPKEWKFKIGQTIKVVGIKRIGMVLDKWHYRDYKIYEVKIGNKRFSFLESEIDSTRYRLCGKVVIEELKSKKLEEGAICRPTKRFQIPFDRYVPYVHRWQ